MASPRLPPKLMVGLQNLTFNHFFKKGFCFWRSLVKMSRFDPANIYLFKVNNRNIRRRCEICSKLTIKIPEWRHWTTSLWCFLCWLWIYFIPFSSACIIDFEQVKIILVHGISNLGRLKVQSLKLYNDKYMIASTQITNTEIFAFIAFLVFKLLSRKVLFINTKNNRNC